MMHSLRNRSPCSAIFFALLFGCAASTETNTLPSPTGGAPPSPVTRVEIIPSVIFVTPRPDNAVTRFELHIRVWDAEDKLIPESDGHEPQWTTSEETESLVKVFHHPTRYPPLPHKIVVGVSVDGTASANEATIHLTANPDDVSDLILAKHVDARPPSIALVNGLRDEDGTSSTCLDDELFSFVNVALPGNLSWGCGSPDAAVSVFSDHHAMSYDPAVQWKEVQDILDVGAYQTSIISLPVKVWIAVEGSESATVSERLQTQLYWQDMAEFDVVLANDILESNSVGISLSMVGGAPERITEGDATTNFQCSQEFANRVPGVLNIYYVDKVQMGRAEYCARSDKVSARGEDVIHIGRVNHSQTSLVHEVGHALALVMPNAMGHTSNMQGVSRDNVMWGFLYDQVQSENRNRFSLGQAFRMNVDVFSWVNHSLAVDDTDPTAVADDGTTARGGDTLACQCRTDVATPCPLLALDVADPDFPGSSNTLRDCSDEVQLRNAHTEEHDAVALLKGHLWRSAPGTCDWFYRIGIPREGDTELSLWLPNLARDPSEDIPEGCKDWELAVFFKTKRLVYYPAIETSGFNYQHQLSGKVLQYDDVPQPPLVIPVNVWYDGSPAAYEDEASSDIETAVQIFSEELEGGHSNRTGMTFDWLMQQRENDWPDPDGTASLTDVIETLRTDCSLGLPSSPYVIDGGINVYYVGENKDVVTDLTFLEQHRGKWCTDGNGTHFILLNPMFPHTATALAHHLGHAFGLSDVTSADDLTWTNVMWHHPPNESGLDARMKFTLGQVFRMNLDIQSWLNESSIRNGLPTVECGGNPDACPAVGMGTGEGDSGNVTNGMEQ
jgi:hypothetical protein